MKMTPERLLREMRWTRLAALVIAIANAGMLSVTDWRTERGSFLFRLAVLCVHAALLAFLDELIRLHVEIFTPAE